MSQLFDTTQPWDDFEYLDEEGYDFESDIELEVGIKCNACFGQGIDRNGEADCMVCDGYGQVYVND